MAKMHRLTLEFNDYGYEILEELSQLLGKTKAEVLRQGLALRKLAEDQRQRGNSLGAVQDGRVVSEIILT